MTEVTARAFATKVMTWFKGQTETDVLLDDTNSQVSSGGREGTLDDEFLKLQGSINDYSISKSKGGDLFIQKRDSSISYLCAKNIELVHFNDLQLSLAELEERIDPLVPSLLISEQLKNKIEHIFNIQNVSVLDTNADGQISAGDTVSGSLLKKSGEIYVHYSISEDNAKHINDEMGEDLVLSQQLISQIDKVVNRLQALSVEGVLDVDGSGKLSEGDIVYSRHHHYLTNVEDPIGGSPVYHSLTAYELMAINSGGKKPSLLSLSDLQKNKIAKIFNILNPSIIDKNGTGEISAGDIVSGSLFRETGSIIVNYTLSKNNAKHINGELGVNLTLSSQQCSHIDKVVNKLQTHFVDGVLDHDGTGKISEGDIIYSRVNIMTTTGAVGGSPVYHKLTENEALAVNSEKEKQPPRLLSLSRQQKAKIARVFNIQNVLVTDNDCTGNISAGDTASGILVNKFDEINVHYSISEDNAKHITGQFGIDLILLLQLRSRIDKVVNKLQPLSVDGVLDNNGSGKLAEGDIVYSRPSHLSMHSNLVGGSPVYHRLTEDELIAINAEEKSI